MLLVSCDIFEWVQNALKKLYWQLGDSNDDGQCSMTTPTELVVRIVQSEIFSVRDERNQTENLRSIRVRWVFLRLFFFFCLFSMQLRPSSARDERDRWRVKSRRRLACYYYVYCDMIGHSYRHDKNNQKRNERKIITFSVCSADWRKTNEKELRKCTSSLSTSWCFASVTISTDNIRARAPEHLSNKTRTKSFKCTRDIMVSIDRRRILFCSLDFYQCKNRKDFDEMENWSAIKIMIWKITKQNDGDYDEIEAEEKKTSSRNKDDNARESCPLLSLLCKRFPLVRFFFSLFIFFSF